MKIADTLKLVLTVLLMGASIALAAFDPVNDDTDIFLANPSISAQRPNVLIVLDNTANWNQAFTNEKNALVQVVNSLSDAFNVGLMMFPETGGANDSIDGGYVRSHVRRMTLQNKTALASLVNNLDITNDKGNNATTGLALHEAYLYFAGKTSIAGHGKVKTDKDGTTDPLLSPLTGHALPAGTSPGLYRSPIEDGCARSFIIYISNGPANENASARSDLEAKLAALTGVTPPAVISITPNGAQSNWADEMAKFMANADVMATNAGVPNSSGVQNVYTYTVEVDPGTTGQGPDMTALMKSVAANGKGKYFAVSSDASGAAIVDALNAIFTEVQAVNSVFASTTLPVSVNVRGTNLNQVYIGVFRPDPAKSPRWLGNLKMYNLALNSATGTVFLADAANDPPPHDSPPPTGNPAENNVTGFVSQNSPSFWTTNSNFWGFRDPSQNGPGGASDYPDGDLVEKGGAAQQLRLAFAGAEAASPLRRIFTCTTGLVGGVSQSCLPNTDFPLANTPFNTLNDAISPASFQLDTRAISPLSAYVTQPVTSISDRLRITSLSNTWWNGFQIQSLSNTGLTSTITSLTTAVPKSVSSLTGIVQGTITVNITSIGKVGGSYVITTDAPFSGVVNGTTVLPVITCSSNTAFNSLSAANRTVSASNSAGPFTYTIPGPSGNHTCSGGTVQGPGPANSTTAQATVGAHGYVSGQAVTITGATPTQFNGTFNVTVIDANRFNYTMTTAGGVAGVNSPTYSSITASGNTTTATAVTSGPHGFASGSSVVISGASDPAYNGTKTISCTPAPGCAGSNSFTYSVGATAIAPNTNTSGVYASQGGSNTVNVTTYSPHGFTDGQTVFISGSDVAGYNGQFTISCGGCTAISGHTTFSYTTATPQPANSNFLVFVAPSIPDYVLGFAPNHGLKAGDSITIEGTPPHGGTFTVLSNFGTDYYFYYFNPGLTSAIVDTNYTVRHTTNHKAWVTIPNHGYSHGQQVKIAGANPAGYNGEPLTIRVCSGSGEGVGCTLDWNIFSFPLTALLGANSSSAVTSSIKSTTARATSVNHGFSNGSTVDIAGATPSAFNGSKVISVVDANTFTYTIATAEGDASGTVVAAQASGSSAERDLIIRWVRGEDNFADENSNTSTTDVRASVHGDVLHSRPAVVNYNRFTGSDDDVFVYYGGNDGIFHAIKGGYKTPTGDSSGLAPGQESWGFIPEEFFGSLKRMRNNAPLISSSFKRPYFMDGPIGVYTLDANADGKLGDTGDKVNLYIANRRGGRFLYALDVNDPTNPKFLWKIDTSTTGFSELGQTWSQPTVVTGLGGLSFPVLVFGAGYDPAPEDLDPAVVTGVNTTTGAITTSSVGTVNRTMGRGIYVVNALTGALVWRAGGAGSGATTENADMIYAIPSDVTIIRNESGGPINRAYVGDTGGNVWRIDFKPDSAVVTPNLNLTTVTKLASVADQSSAAGRRKFLFPPDVVGQDGFDAILIGSGDREHPFDSTVTNRFYMFKDKGTDLAPITGTTTCDPTITEGSIPDGGDACAPNPGDIPGMSDLTLNCIQNPTSAACVGAGQTDVAALTAKLGSDRGWFITLGSGEKVVGNAISIGGTTFFNTNQPSATAGGGTCGSNLGVARQYQVATADATATSDLNVGGGLTGADRSLIHAGGGYLPSPVHVVVMLGGKPVEAVISGIQVSTPAGASLSARLRKYWYREIDVK